MRLFALLVLLAAPPADPAESLLARVDAAYRDAPALRMAFEQTSTGPSHFEPLVQRGKLQIERPGSVRWEFESPARRAWISDGETLWMVEPADKTVQVVRPVDAAVRRYLALLGGLQDVRARFDVTAQGDVLTLKPKDRDQAVARVEVTVDAQGVIVQVAVFDPFGDRTALSLSSIERLADLPDDQFRYVPPAGWTVVGP